MAVIAFVCPPFAAHIASFRALGEELAQRGHRCFFLMNAGAAGGTGELAIVHVAARYGDPDARRVLANAESPAGLFGTLRTIADSAAMTDQLCSGGRAILEAQSADLVVGDQMEPAGTLLAHALGLPFVGLACAVPMDPAPGVPLPFLDWPYEPDAVAKHRRTARIAKWLSAKQNRVIADWARRFGLPPRESLTDCLGAVQVAQMVPALDFPRPEPLPFVPVGPLRRPAELAEVDLPFALPIDRPLVFASMGTLLGGEMALWRALAEAAHEAEVALVLVHGGRLGVAEAASLDVHHAAAFLPYRAVLRHAALCITHGGSNTLLDAMACGVPVLVRPVSFDQPGNLGRVRHHGLGEALQPMPKTFAIAGQIRRLIADEAMRARCRVVGAALEAAGGAPRAADVVEGELQRAGNSRLESP